jgi:hypothetical protein
MSCVAGGVFIRGVADGHACDQTDQPRDGHPSEVPAQAVFVETFYMDRTEVTVAAYEACIDSGACRDTGPVYADFDAPDQPITAVSWYDAVAYCEAQGQHLPTEAEWELAARGHDGELNPWGNAPTSCQLAVIMDETGRSCGEPQRSGQPDAGRVFPVMSRSAGRFDLFDMVGNAEEWVADWWSEDWTACGADCQGDNPRGPCAGEAVFAIAIGWCGADPGTGQPSTPTAPTADVRVRSTIPRTTTGIAAPLRSTKRAPSPLSSIPTHRPSGHAHENWLWAASTSTTNRSWLPSAPQKRSAALGAPERSRSSVTRIHTWPHGASGKAS